MKNNSNKVDSKKMFCFGKSLPSGPQETDTQSLRVFEGTKGQAEVTVHCNYHLLQVYSCHLSS